MDYIYEVAMNVSRISINNLLESFEMQKVKLVRPITISFVFTKEMSKERLDKVIDIFIEESKKKDLLHEVISIKEVKDII